MAETIAVLVKDDNNSDRTREIVDFIEESIDDINAGGIYIDIVPVNANNRQKVLDDGITRYPTALYNRKKYTGVEEIQDLIASRLEEVLAGMEQMQAKRSRPKKKVYNDFHSLIHDEMSVERKKMEETEKEVTGGEAAAKAAEWAKRRQETYKNNPNNPSNSPMRSDKTAPRGGETRRATPAGGIDNVVVDDADLDLLNRGDADDNMIATLLGNTVTT